MENGTEAPKRELTLDEILDVFGDTLKEISKAYKDDKKITIDEITQIIMSTSGRLYKEWKD